MKKISAAVIIAFIVGVAVGALGYYAYYESQMSDAEKAVRALAKAGKQLGE